jgi:hypothetical protein
LGFDPDPAYHFDADPNPAYNSDAVPDPGPTLHFNADPNPVPDPAYHLIRILPFNLMRIRIRNTAFCRLILAGGSAVVALADPWRGDMVAVNGEVTGHSALRCRRPYFTRVADPYSFHSDPDTAF